MTATATAHAPRRLAASCAPSRSSAASIRDIEREVDTIYYLLVIFADRSGPCGADLGPCRAGRDGGGAGAGDVRPPDLDHPALT